MMAECLIEMLKLQPLILLASFLDFLFLLAVFGAQDTAFYAALGCYMGLMIGCTAIYIRMI